MFCFSFLNEMGAAEKAHVELLTQEQTFVAGTDIVLSFSYNADTSPMLLVSSSYGSTLVEALKDENKLNYSLPQPLCKKTGRVNWVLVLNQAKLLAGSVKIVPDVASETMIENYFGPRQIRAGNDDFSMLVSVPTDAFDNPLPEGSSVFVNQQNQKSIQESELKINNLFAWQNIYSKKEAGVIVVSTSVNDKKSKELTTFIHPSNAKDFKISFSRNHNFADGNQLTEFVTSVIKDSYGNVVSEGTMVEFGLTNGQGYVLKTYGETVNGTATAKMLHPSKPDMWNVKAYITGIAESNEIELSYLAALRQIDVNLLEGNRKVVVGPLKSYMTQLIPDGMEVKLNVLQKDSVIETKTAYSSEGMVTFYLSPEFFKSGSYSFEIDAMGLTQELNEINLHDDTE